MTLGKNTLDRLGERARQIRIGALWSIFHAGSGHPGGSLSCADLLAYLWTRRISFDPARPGWEERDRFVLSKGHACPALYALLADLSILPRDLLPTLRQLGSPLQGHPSVQDLPWVETSTGSLAQGFSFAVGAALGLHHKNLESSVYALMGDGELQEGEVWEGAMCAAHHKLGKLWVIVDYNKLQSDDLNENILGLEPLADKWSAFGWNVFEVDGHDFLAMDSVFGAQKPVPGAPTAILAHTLKGKGVSWMEGSPPWHGSVELSVDQLRQSLAELGVPQTEISAYLTPPVLDRKWTGVS